MFCSQVPQIDETLSVLIKNFNKSTMRRAWVQALLLCSRDKHCTTASSIKVSNLKLGVYLILEVHNTLDPT